MIPQNNYSNEIVGTGYLAFRDLASLFANYGQTKGDALDYGCGRGRSSRFLKSLGFNVDAVDSCPQMIEQAKKQGQDINYQWLKPFSGQLQQATYDVVLAQLVLVEIKQVSDIKRMLAEQRLALKKDGLLVHTTTSDAFFKQQWLTIETSPMTKVLTEGQPIEIVLKNRQIKLTSHYWSESFLEQQFIESGLQILEKHSPKGMPDDPYLWRDELKVSPYVQYVTKIKD